MSTSLTPQLCQTAVLLKWHHRAHTMLLQTDCAMMISHTMMMLHVLFQDYAVQVRIHWKDSSFSSLATTTTHVTRLLPGFRFKKAYGPVDKSVAKTYRERLIKCYKLQYSTFDVSFAPCLHVSFAGCIPFMLLHVPPLHPDCQLHWSDCLTLLQHSLHGIVLHPSSSCTDACSWCWLCPAYHTRERSRPARAPAMCMNCCFDQACPTKLVRQTQTL